MMCACPERQFAQRHTKHQLDRQSELNPKKFSKFPHFYWISILIATEKF